jgi:hypothetical protein
VVAFSAPANDVETDGVDDKLELVPPVATIDVLA